jgi:molybdopterin synthase sulfur carrier subunit
MAVKVRIPTPLRTLTQGVDQVEIAGSNVGEVLNQLSAKFDGIDKRLFKQPGELNRFVNIYVNDEDIRFLDNLNTPIKDGDDLSIVPAIAGG